MAFNIFVNDVASAIVGRAGIEHRHNARVTQAGDALRLVQQFLGTLALRRIRLMPHFDGHVALQLRIVSQVNGAKRARADLFANFIAADDARRFSYSVRASRPIRIVVAPALCAAIFRERAGRLASAGRASIELCGFVSSRLHDHFPQARASVCNSELLYLVKRSVDVFVFKSNQSPSNRRSEPTLPTNRRR